MKAGKILTKTVQKNKMMTKECHKNKNMLLDFRDSYGYRQKMKIPSEIEDALLAKGMQKRPWGGHILLRLVLITCQFIVGKVKNIAYSVLN